MDSQNVDCGRRDMGRVAGLPVALRNVVNEALRDGKEYGEVISELESHGIFGITRWVLGRWRRAGYARWLREQEAFERLHGLSAEKRGLMGQLQPGGGSVLADLSEAMLASQLGELLESFDGEARRERMEDYLKVARTLIGFMMARAQRQRVELERHRRDVTRRKGKPKGRKKGLSHEEAAELTERINLM